jgi:hypothetical protein
MRKFTMIILLAVGFLSELPGCAPVKMPAVNLASPQWHVRRGQAIWKPGPGRMEFTGDLLVAQNTEGDVWISLTKSLLPIFTARTWDNTWSINFVKRGESHSGHGKPPYHRFIWFFIPDILNGTPPPPEWEAAQKDDEFSLRNVRTGEEIKMVFDS